MERTSFTSEEFQQDLDEPLEEEIFTFIRYELYILLFQKMVVTC